MGIKSLINGLLCGLVSPGQLKAREPVAYLTFSSAAPFTISVNDATKHWDGALYYSTNAAAWIEWDGTTAIASEEHGGEQRVYMRGLGNRVITGDAIGYSEWVLTGTDIRCNGNIETLLDYETVASGEHPSMGDYCYYRLFGSCASLTTAPDLPATTLTKGCYYRMFWYCTNLTTAPALPATELADYCYKDMFVNCISLTTAPALPATTLASSCYYEMFWNCISLTTAPALPATTLTHGCYGGMFSDCTSLATAPALPATELADRCYQYMFSGCTSLTTVPALPATTLAVRCYEYMFFGCTNLTTVPALPATTLAVSCYEKMFMGCAKIKLSAAQTEEYPTAYRIPVSGTGIGGGSYSSTDMFENTGGTFTGTPEINTTYYTSNPVV